VRTLTPLRPLIFTVLLGAAALLLSGCDLFSSPQNTFDTAGPVAEDQKRWFLWAVYPATVIMFGVFGAIIYILWRFRRREGAPLPPQVHGNTLVELTWTIAPAILLMFFVPVVIIGIVRFEDIPDDSVHVDVTGVQWNWQFTYRDANGEEIVGNFGDPLHIPVGQSVALTLHSEDVIHSFWVPKLAGKTDVIPGRQNTMWFRADEAGTFNGQCAEFCGAGPGKGARGHADMRLTVIAESREDYDAYLAELVAARDGNPDAAEAVEAER
jgi:cytochrome c oxidase subunit 2